jgi:hypothetical protein
MKVTENIIAEEGGETLRKHVAEHEEENIIAGEGSR